MTLVSASVATQTIPSGSTATGVVPVVLDNGASKANHTMIVTVSSGTFTSGTVTLQLSQDGTNWFSVASPPTLTTNAVFEQSVVKVAQFARASITAAIVGGCTVGVTVASA